MDTEKKVQFVALTKEEIDAMIQQAALAGAQVASESSHKALRTWMLHFLFSLFVLLPRTIM